MKDLEIIAAIERDDPNRVMNFLYKKEYPKLEKYVLRNSGSKEDAMDVFQEAVLALYSHIKLKKFDPKYEIGAFLYVVGCNCWKRINRKKMVMVNENSDHISELEENTTYNRIFENESRNIINQLFDKIGENCKKILEMSFYQNFSLKEIREELDYDSDDIVKTRRYKCKQKLILLLKENPKYSLFLKENLR